MLREATTSASLFSRRWSIDLRGVILESDDKYLLRPSVLGAAGEPKVYDDCVRGRLGILLAFRCLVLADRAREALVGVVMALGSFVGIWDLEGECIRL